MIDFTFLFFFSKLDQKQHCVFYSMCLGKERWMAEQVAQMLNEKCKVLETLSKCQQEVGVNIA